MITTRAVSHFTFLARGSGPEILTVARFNCSLHGARITASLFLLFNWLKSENDVCSGWDGGRRVCVTGKTTVLLPLECFLCFEHICFLPCQNLWMTPSTLDYFLTTLKPFLLFIIKHAVTSCWISTQVLRAAWINCELIPYLLPQNKLCFYLMCQ